MKKLLSFVAAVFLLGSCYVDIDWDYNGYAEIKNETSQTVTITIAPAENSPIIGGHSHMPYRPSDGVVKAGEALTQYYWYPDQESIKSGLVPLTVTIALSDGSKILCSPDSDASWSRRFYDNSETRKSALWSHFQRHEIVIETYHIDEELLELWRASLRF